MPATSQQNSSVEIGKKLGPKRDNSIAPPSVTLPKGGGAIRGIGEKFTANPATGTGGISIPLPISQGRSDFAPELTLNYDSGAGNSPFGLGWNVSLPSITRKTDKGLPRYDDSDVFILAGAEDLVPELKLDESGKSTVWEECRSVDGADYQVRRYRPRTEGLFSRIERWTRIDNADTHWRSISKDNVTTLYGLRETKAKGDFVASRVVDPYQPHRIFSWLICKSYDDKGNAIEYSYLPEDSEGVNDQQANEANRTPTSRSAGRYIKSVRYGNAKSLLAESEIVSPLGPDLTKMEWHFEVVFDYGEGHLNPKTKNATGRLCEVSFAGNQKWLARTDSYSRYRSGFEVRTYRRCQRILLFHHFTKELPKADCLVRSLELGYAERTIASFLTSVESCGYVYQQDEIYLQRSLPPLEFEYSRSPLEDFHDDEFPIQDFQHGSLANVPSGTGDGYQWLDLDGEGISGLLTDQGRAWYYKPNLGCGRLDDLQVVNPQPSLAALANGRQQFLDLSGDGHLELVELQASVGGFFERTEDNTWSPFQEFRCLPRLNWQDQRLRFVDLTGDGLADVLITESDELTWFESLAEEGFRLGGTMRLSSDEERSPRVIFSDPTQAIFMADMSGDGLSDIVRIRQGEVSYWPNLGYGRFGPRVTMDNSPWFDFDGQFDPRHLSLADTDGSGVADILYHGRNGVAICLNRSGNSWTTQRLIDSVPPQHHLSSLSTVDLLGEGTVCLVWSSSLPSDMQRSMKYIDLMKGRKPHLLIIAKNNLGAETHIATRRQRSSI